LRLTTCSSSFFSALLCKQYVSSDTCTLQEHGRELYGGEVDLVCAHDAIQYIVVGLAGNTVEARVRVPHSLILSVASGVAACCDVQLRSAHLRVHEPREEERHTKERLELGGIDHEDDAQLMALTRPQHQIGALGYRWGDASRGEPPCARRWTTRPPR
jgi:hypothetical protein